jgi:hypothetical protein
MIGFRKPKLHPWDIIGLQSEISVHVSSSVIKLLVEGAMQSSGYWFYTSLFWLH